MKRFFRRTEINQHHTSNTLFHWEQYLYLDSNRIICVALKDKSKIERKKERERKTVKKSKTKESLKYHNGKIGQVGISIKLN